MKTYSPGLICDSEGRDFSEGNINEIFKYDAVNSNVKFPKCNEFQL